MWLPKEQESPTSPVGIVSVLPFASSSVPLNGMLYVPPDGHPKPELWMRIQIDPRLLAPPNQPSGRATYNGPAHRAGLNRLPILFQTIKLKVFQIEGRLEFDEPPPCLSCGHVIFRADPSHSRKNPEGSGVVENVGELAGVDGVGI